MLRTTTPLKLCLLTGLALLTLLAGFRLNRAATQAQDAPAAAAATTQAQTADSLLYLPLAFNEYNPRIARRIGFSTSVSPVSLYPAIRSLNAGWYVDWVVNANAVQPGGARYLPMVRMHQKLTCPVNTTPDRVACPYVEPHAYEYSPDAASITAYAQANPGLTWLIGNEMDRLDWAGGGQDEMLPTLYPRAYKEITDIIKTADPTAKLAIGGVIQPTPLRLGYLTTVWNKYKEYYGVEMPVDVWNVHAFVVSEECRQETSGLICYGGGVPPGANTLQGDYLGQDWKHIDRTTFEKQIRAFRGWMKDRGQQKKPLIVTEYGVLYVETACINGCPNPAQYNLKDPDVIHSFMLWTFDYFLNARDCNLSEIDDCHLVQEWAWFSLEDVQWEFNPYTTLFDRATREIQPAGEKFRDYTNANFEALSRGY